MSDLARFRVDRLEQAMAQAGCNSAELSRASGVSKGAISQILSGANNPRIETVQAIADVFNKPYRWFYEDLVKENEEPFDIMADISSMVNVPVPVAAKFIGIGQGSLRKALQDNRCPFGFAVKKEQWSYHISAYKLLDYMGKLNYEKKNKKLIVRQDE